MKLERINENFKPFVRSADVEDPQEQFKSKIPPKRSKFEEVAAIESSFSCMNSLFDRTPLELAEKTCISFAKEYRTRHFQKDIGGVKVTKRDLDTLDPCQWLNDRVILAYLRMVTENSDTMVVDPLFFKMLSSLGPSTVSNRYKSLSFSDMRAVFFPICANHHWRLVVFYPGTLDLEYYDSKNVGGDVYLETVKAFLQFKEKAEDHDARPIKCISKTDVPQQEGSDDCGVYIILFIKMLIIKI